MWHCQYKTRISNAFNAIYVDTVDNKTHPHIPAHNFLNIQWIFNPHNSFGKAETQGFPTIPSKLYMSTLSIQEHMSL